MGMIIFKKDPGLKLSIGSLSDEALSLLMFSHRKTSQQNTSPVWRVQEAPGQSPTQSTPCHSFSASCNTTNRKKEN